MLAELSDAESLRYNRQIVLRGFDFNGQETLKVSRVLIVGLGGLGCTAAQYLAVAGIGHLTLLDSDTVSLSNLQRQILHHDERIGMAKVESARLTLAHMNPYLTLTALQDQPDDEQLATIITDHQLVLDCTDNIKSREMLNRLCYAQRKPLISGAAIRMEGQISVFTYQADEPCYRCLSRLFNDNSLTCVETGVLAPLVGVIGSLQAMEAIKWLTHYGQITPGRILMYDAMTSEFRSFKLKKDPNCELCCSESSVE